MKNSEKNEKAFDFFKEPYSYKMGGTQIVILPNGKQKHFDDRKYYSGRGAKFNKSIQHDLLGEIKVSRKRYSAFLHTLKERENAILQREKLEAEKAARYNDFKIKGLYELSQNDWTKFIVLSSEESTGRYFDAERLAKTFDISVNDAELLRSIGKTYVFAKQNSSGKIIRFYHSSLECNNLAISFSYPTKKEIEKFNHEDWLSAPFAHLVGQTDNKNHFVC